MRDRVEPFAKVALVKQLRLIGEEGEAVLFLLAGFWAILSVVIRQLRVSISVPSCRNAMLAKAFFALYTIFAVLILGVVVVLHAIDASHKRMEVARRVTPIAPLLGILIMGRYGGGYVALDHRITTQHSIFASRDLRLSLRNILWLLFDCLVFGCAVGTGLYTKAYTATTVGVVTFGISFVQLSDYAGFPRSLENVFCSGILKIGRKWPSAAILMPSSATTTKVLQAKRNLGVESYRRSGSDTAVPSTMLGWPKERIMDKLNAWKTSCSGGYLCSVLQIAIVEREKATASAAALQSVVGEIDTAANQKALSDAKGKAEIAREREMELLSAALDSAEIYDEAAQLNAEHIHYFATSPVASERELRESIGEVVREMLTMFECAMKTPEAYSSSSISGAAAGEALFAFLTLMKHLELRFSGMNAEDANVALGDYRIDGEIEMWPPNAAANIHSLLKKSVAPDFRLLLGAVLDAYPSNLGCPGSDSRGLMACKALWTSSRRMRAKKEQRDATIHPWGDKLLGISLSSAVPGPGMPELVKKLQDRNISALASVVALYSQPTTIRASQEILIGQPDKIQQAYRDADQVSEETETLSERPAFYQWHQALLTAQHVHRLRQATAASAIATSITSVGYLLSLYK